MSSCLRFGLVWGWLGHPAWERCGGRVPFIQARSASRSSKPAARPVHPSPQRQQGNPDDQSRNGRRPPLPPRLKAGSPAARLLTTPVITILLFTFMPNAGIGLRPSACPGMCRHGHSLLCRCRFWSPSHLQSRCERSGCRLRSESRNGGPARSGWFANRAWPVPWRPVSAGDLRARR